MLRDTVRTCRQQGFSYEEIAEILAFECGVAEAVAYNLDLIQSRDDGEVDAVIADVINSNAKAVADYKGGKKAALGSLVGSVKKKAPHLNAKDVQEGLKKVLG